jgi:hypothetical protein
MKMKIAGTVVYIFKQHNIFDLNGKSEEDVTWKRQKELLFVASF